MIEKTRESERASGSSAANKKTIPITKLRNFYNSLAGFRLSTETQRNIVEDFNRKENFKQLIALYKESKDHFAKKYENIKEPFISKSNRKPLPVNVVSISTTRDVISVLKAKNQPIEVKNNLNLGFKYIQREVSPWRTTNAVFETGNSGKSSGLGGLDFIGWNGTKKLPILGEIKVGGDQNPFYALIQLLTYLSELSTPNQIERINKTKLFGNNIVPMPGTSFYLYLLFTDLRGEKKKILDRVKILAKKLEKPAIQEMEEIVFLNIHPETKEIAKI